MVNQWSQRKCQRNIYQIYPDIAFSYLVLVCRIKQRFQRLMYDIDKNTSVRYPKKLSAVKLSCSRKIEVKWNQYNSYKVTNPKTKWSIIDSVVQPISCSVEVLYSLITYFRNKNCITGCTDVLLYYWYIYKWSFQICEWYRVYCTHTWYTWDTTTQSNNIHINKSHGGLYWYRYLVIGRFVNEIKLAYPVSSAVCVMDHCAINIITIHLKYDRWTNTPFKFK